MAACQLVSKRPEAQFSDEAYVTLLLAKINKPLEAMWKVYTIHCNKVDDDFSKSEVRNVLCRLDTQTPKEDDRVRQRLSRAYFP